MNKILETHTVFEDGKLKEVAVLWDDNAKGVRATYKNSRFNGYPNHIPATETVNMELYQNVADYGVYITDSQKLKYFPGKRNWTR